MGNRNKKIWSMLLSLVLVVTTIFGTTLIPQATKTYAAEDSSQITDVKDNNLLSGTITVHFRRPASWTSTPRIYAFVKDSNDITLAHLSGTEWKYRQRMTEETKVGNDTWYSYEVPRYTGTGTTYVVFSNGGSDNVAQYPPKVDEANKKDEIRLKLTGETWYYLHDDVQKMDTYTTNPISSATPSVTPTNTSTPSATPTGKTIRIHFRKPTEWNNTPKIYAYLKEQKESDENKDNTTLVHFSGDKWAKRQEMKLEGTKGRDTWYYFDIPEYSSGYAYAIFTNGSAEKEEDDKNTARYPADKKYEKYLLVTGETWYYLDSGLNMKVYTDNQTSDLTTPTPTATTKPSAAPTATVTASTTPTATATATPTATATVEPSATPTATATATVEPSVTPTATAEVPDQTPVVADPTDVPTDATPDVVPTQAVPTAEVPQATTPVQTAPPTQPVPTGTPNVTVTVPTGSAASDNSAITPSAVTAKVTFSKTGKTVGETVLIKVALSKKKSAAAYTYSYYIDGKAVKSNSSSATYEWTLTSKGVHKVTVIVKENNKMVTHKEVTYKVNPRVITIQKFKTNKKSGQKAKSKITLSVMAKTTAGKLSYRFAVQKGKGKVTYLGKYGKKKKVVWKPASKGTYTLYVYAKNGKGVEVKKAIKNFKIK